MASDPLQCPRDKKVMHTAQIGEASVEVCGACYGTFFDSGDMLKASGIAADPITWDRPETGGAIKEGSLLCPRCTVVMPAQDIKYEGKEVEIDRCGKCGGIWLDKGELDTIVEIGHKLRPIVDAERAAAQAELAKVGADVSFADRTNKWKLGGLIGVAATVLLGVLVFRQCEREEARRRAREEQDFRSRVKHEEGCPCGCDHSKAMAADLRTQGGDEALRAIERTLVTISERENAGYITERMIQHRLRLLDVAEEIRPGIGTTYLSKLVVDHERAHAQRCKASSAANDSVRVCSDLVVHGERIEIVNGKEKLITPSFRLWLEIENLTATPRAVQPPSLRARTIHLPISRWYEEDTRGTPWTGELPAKKTVRVHVIGDIPEHVAPLSEIDAAIEIESLTLPAKTEARAVLHLHDG